MNSERPVDYISIIIKSRWTRCNSCYISSILSKRQAIKTLICLFVVVDLISPKLQPALMPSQKTVFLCNLYSVALLTTWQFVLSNKVFTYYWLGPCKCIGAIRPISQYMSVEPVSASTHRHGWALNMYLLHTALFKKGNHCSHIKRWRILGKANESIH